MMDNLGAVSMDIGSMELVQNDVIKEMGDDIEQVYETLSDVLTR